MPTFDFAEAADTTLETIDATWAGDSTEFETDGSGNLRPVSNGNTEVFAWYPGGENEVTWTEGATVGSELFAATIHSDTGQEGYRPHINYTNGADTIVDVRMFRNGTLYGTNITPTIARQTGVPMIITLRVNGASPEVVLDNGTTTETLTWPADGAPLSGHPGVYVNPNFNASTTLISSWETVTASFAITSVSDTNPQTGDTITVNLSAGNGSETVTLGGVSITPDAQDSSSITLTMPDLSTDNDPRPWNAGLALVVNQGALQDTETVIVSPPTGYLVGTVAGYTHTQNGDSLFDAQDLDPANDIVNGDQYEIEILTGAFTISDAGVVTPTTLPATYNLRIFDVSAGVWTASDNGSVIEDAGSNPPVFSGTIPAQSLTIDTPMSSINLNAYFDPDATTYTDRDMSLPSGVTISGNLVQGTADTLQGATAVIFRGTNADGFDDSNSVLFTVSATPPVFEGVIPDQNLTVGVAMTSFDLDNYFTPDADTYSDTGSLPAGLSLVGSIVSGTPTAPATEALTFTGTNTAGSDTSNSVLFTVAAAPDAVPNAFAFVTASAQPISSVITSAAITPEGYNTTAAVTVAGGEVSIDGGAWVTSGNIDPGETIRARGTSSGSYDTITQVTVTIGGVAGTFNIETELAPDTTPDPFSFDGLTGQPVSTADLTSDYVVLSGLDAGASYTVTGGEAQIGVGSWGTSGTYTPGDSVRLRVDSSASFDNTTTATLTVGGISGTFSVTTISAPEIIFAAIAGDSLLLSANRSLSVGAGGSGGVTLTASGGAVTATFVSAGPILTLSLSRTPAITETVTVDYTQPGNGFEDTQLNDLPSFSDLPVNFGGASEHTKTTLLHKGSSKAHNSLVKQHHRITMESND